jgi:hypothetical protein
MDAQRRSFWLIKICFTSGRACILRISSGRAESPLSLMIAPGFGLIFPAMMAILSVRQSDLPAGTAKPLALSNGFESSATASDLFRKMPDGSLNRLHESSARKTREKLLQRPNLPARQLRV